MSKFELDYQKLAVFGQFSRFLITLKFQISFIFLKQIPQGAFGNFFPSSTFRGPAPRVEIHSLSKNVIIISGLSMA